MLLAEGFEAQSLSLLSNLGWSVPGFSSIWSTAGQVHQDLSGRGGVRSFQMAGNQSFTTPPIPTSAYRLSFWVVPRTIPTGTFYVAFLRSGNQNVAVQFNGVDFKVRVQTVANGSDLATSAGTINPNIPHWITIEVVCANAGGTVTVKVDGATVVTYTGDTQTSATANWDQVRWFTPPFNDIILDDIIIQTVAEADPGESFIERRPVTSNDSIQSTSSGGGAGTFANVDEVPFSTADYNEFTTTQQDTYGIAAGTWTSTSVAAVQVVYYAARDGAVTTFEPVLKSGATTSLGAANALGAAGAYVFGAAIYTTDPNTGIAWVPGAAVDAIKVGGKFT